MNWLLGVISPLNSKKNNISNVALIFLSFVISSLILVGLSYYEFINWRDLWLIKYIFIFLMFSVFIYTSFFNKITYIINIMILLIISFYSFIGVNYGLPNLSMVVAMTETDGRESVEFFRNYPINGYISVALLLFFTYIYARVGVRSIGVAVNNIFLVFYFILFYILLLSTPGTLFQSFIRVGRQINEYKQEINSHDHNPSVTIKKLTSNHNRYKYYIVIVGESVRTDYMSLYGYGADTTPFLNNVNGVFYKNFYAMAPTTSESLRYILTAPDERGDYKISNNIVSIANMAGYHTSWLSNQGAYGKHDNLSARIGSDSNNIIFTKRGGYNDWDVDDFKLIDLLKNIVNNNNNSGSNVIFLHMIGSHEETCKRIGDFQPRFNDLKSRDVNCYLTTILKLDIFIKSISELLKEHGDSYSIVYLSDHGLDITNDNIKHNYIYKQIYHIPMFMISSDDTDRKWVGSHITGAHFSQIFTNWIGVELGNSKPGNLDIVSDNQHNIKVYSPNTLTPFTKLQNQDPLRE